MDPSFYRNVWFGVETRAEETNKNLKSNKEKGRSYHEMVLSVLTALLGSM